MLILGSNACLLDEINCDNVAISCLVEIVVSPTKILSHSRSRKSLFTVKLLHEKVQALVRKPNTIIMILAM